ncbi:MAG: hypothetical protein LV481_00815 [Methylacidiphilales bacterium]|nr:hypothetical protein [Candidatus Methylacidiphilales bacterium]
MKRAAKITERRIIAFALTWDGARWPVRALSPRARAFLANPARKPASFTISSLTRLFKRDGVDEIRICWVPRLKGGTDVLASPFFVPKNGRLQFQSVRQVRLGDDLGVVYRRVRSSGGRR